MKLKEKRGSHFVIALITFLAITKTQITDKLWSGWWTQWKHWGAEWQSKCIIWMHTSTTFTKTLESLVKSKANDSIRNWNDLKIFTGTKMYRTSYQTIVGYLLGKTIFQWIKSIGISRFNLKHFMFFSINIFFVSFNMDFSICLFF